MNELMEILRVLRSPDGCVWDKEQTHLSLKPHMLEEAAEAVEAIDEGDPEHLKEELGDVLLQVAFHSSIAADNGDFTIEDVIETLKAKLIRRHPHVFGDVKINSIEELEQNWARIKAQEKLNKTG